MQIDRRPSIFNFVLVAVLLAVLGGGERASAQTCQSSDISGNGIVDGEDMALLLGSWGTNNAAADVNGDGVVEGADLAIFLGVWGPCVVVPSWATLVEAYPDSLVVTDANLRAAITATGLAWRVKDTATQIEMMLIPPGTFDMGCIQGSNQYGCYGWELPVHQVTLTSAFYLGRTEVTQAQWLATMGYELGFYPGPNNPVEQVSWDLIQGFLSLTGMRLPTEAEWEFACRAGTTTPYYNGSTDDSTLTTLAWYFFNTCEGGTGCGTRPVATKLPNGFGLYDTLGNVWEWVSDCHGNYSAGAQTDPQGPLSGTYRVLRGGSWVENSYGACRASDRCPGAPGYQPSYFGFRVARTP